MSLLVPARNEQSYMDKIKIMKLPSAKETLLASLYGNKNNNILAYLSDFLDETSPNKG